MCICVLYSLGYVRTYPWTARRRTRSRGNTSIAKDFMNIIWPHYLTTVSQARSTGSARSCIGEHPLDSTVIGMTGPTRGREKDPHTFHTNTHTNPGDRFGFSIVHSDDGTIFNDDNSENAGHVRFSTRWEIKTSAGLRGLMKKIRFSLKERSSTKYIRTHVTTPGPTINTDLATRIYISAYPMEFGRIQRRHDFNRTNEPSSRSRLQPSRCQNPPPNRCFPVQLKSPAIC